MRTARFVTIAASVFAALAVGLGPAAAQTSTPTAKEVATAKAALKKYMAANAPKKESKPTSLDQCPWGDNLVTDLASQQDGYDPSATSDPSVMSSVFVDQSIDQGTRSVPCTVQYTDTAGDSQYLTVVAYADPGVKTPAFAKALAKQMKGSSKTVRPPSPTLAGGKVEAYCIEKTTPPQCAYVWNRNGLYVEIDSPVESDSNFTALHDVVLAAVDSLQTLKG
jgi:predicted component of type VI protein secretion system